MQPARQLRYVANFKKQEVKVVLAHTVIIECAIRICAILLIYNVIRIVHVDLKVTIGYF